MARNSCREAQGTSSTHSIGLAAPYGRINSTTNKPKLVGDFIESLLDPETLEITALDPVDILARICESKYTATLCKRNGVRSSAYIILLRICYIFTTLIVARITMPSGSSSKQLSSRRTSSTNTTKYTMRLLVNFYMVFLLA